MEATENEESAVGRTEAINKIFGIDWMQKKHNLANSNSGAKRTYSHSGNASVHQGKPSEPIGSAAFRNVIENLFEIQERSSESVAEGTRGKVSHSLKDSMGKELSKEQAEFFKNSKIRDENVNLKVMYRGDANEITVFDRKKSEPSNLYGRGFYFTDSKEHAGQYGNATEYYLDIKKPLSHSQNRITKE